MKQKHTPILTALLLAISIIIVGCSHELVWQNTEGPFNGIAMTLAVGPNDVLLAGTNYDIYRSTNNGSSWRSLHANFWHIPYSWLNKLFIAPNGTSYAVTADSNLFRSTDFGDTWTALPVKSSDGKIQRFIITAKNDLYAVVNGIEIFCSSDNGNTWLKMDMNLPVSKIHSLTVDSAYGMILSSDTIAYRSKDQGRSWSMIQVGLRNKQGVFTFNSSGDIFCATSGNVGVYRSTDDGNSWSNSFQIRKPHPKTGDTIVYPVILKSLQINSQGHIYINADDKFFRSTDNGDHWTYIPLIQNQRIPIVSSAINSRDEIFASTSMYGIFQSTDGGANWSSLALKFVTVNLYSLATNSKGSLFAASDSGVFRSFDKGNSWVPCNKGFHDFASARSLTLNSKGELYSGIFPDEIYSLNNDESSWTSVGRKGMYVAFTSTDSMFVGSGLESAFGYRWRSQDNNWTILDSTLAMGPRTFAFNSQGHVFAGSVYGTVFRSTDNCASWKELRNGLTGYNVESILINSNGAIIAATLGGIVRSTNNGDDWVRVDKNLPFSIKSWNDRTNTPEFYNFPQINAAIQNSQGNIYIGYDRGVFVSDDFGNSWKELNEGLPLYAKITALTFDPDGYLYAGTEDGMVYKSKQIFGK